MKEELKGMWFRIVIIDNEEDMLDRLHNIQQKLRDSGCYFDTGYGFPHNGNLGYRDWEMDWSLEGGTSEEIIDILNEQGIEYSIENLREPDAKTLKHIAEWREIPEDK